MENTTGRINTILRAMERAGDKQEYSDYIGIMSPEERHDIDTLVLENAKKNKTLYHYSWTVDPNTGSIDYTLMGGNNPADKGRALSDIHNAERHTKVIARLHKKLKEKGKTPNNTFRKI